MPLIPGLSAGLVQDYLQSLRDQYNNNNNLSITRGMQFTFLGQCKGSE